MSAEDRLAKLLVLLILSIIDISFNAAAGAAAVATGAHVNGDPTTPFALQVGVVAAVTSAGIQAFVAFLRHADIGIAGWILFIVILSKFGIAVLVTAQVSSRVLGEVPPPLLIAAIVAAVPWQAEGFGPSINCTSTSTSSYSYSDGFTTTTTTDSETDVNPCSFITKYFYIIGWDALVGYTFARMAQNQGIDICSLGAAAAAGGVFGVLSGISTTISTICMSLIYEGEPI